MTDTLAFMKLANRLHASMRHGVIAWSILSMGVALAATTAWFTHQYVAQESRLRFNADTRELHRRIEAEIGTYEQALVGLRALFAARDSVSRGEFKRYVVGLELN